MGETEIFKINERLHSKVSSLEIAKELGCDHRAVKKFVISPTDCNGRSDKGKIRKQARRKKEVRRNPLQTSKEVFERASVSDVPKSTRYRLLRRIGKCEKPKARPPSKDIHKKKRMDWAKNNMKVNFHVLDGSDVRKVEAE